MMKDHKHQVSPENISEDPTAQPTEEQLAQGLNTDENRAGSEGLADELSEDGGSQAQQELAAMQDKYLRLAAEFENYKRRTNRERIELLQTAGKDIMASLLEVLDDADRASQSLANENAEQAKEGVSLVFSKLRSLLQARGLKQMEAAGADFDPELHDAIAEIAAPGQEGKVVDVVTPGYFLNDKIIRHAKVVVGK